MSLNDFWKRLSEVSSLSFTSISPLATGWNGTGSGSVKVDVPESGTLLFHERGEWMPSNSSPLRFSNVFRWLRGDDPGTIRLEHLRFGPERPVYLFDLQLISGQSMASVEPHLCREDRYTAELRIDDDQVRLDWAVNGPDKNETIAYVYT